VEHGVRHHAFCGRHAAREIAGRLLRALGLVPPPGTDLCGVSDVEGVFGYENLCPHEYITLNLQKNVRTIGTYILCDHHYARFRFDDGISDDGVCAGEGLPPIPLVIEAGRIVIGSPTG
jgi:nitrite reductase/ring-hydroxylating ferredoxin subunit